MPKMVPGTYAVAEVTMEPKIGNYYRYHTRDIHIVFRLMQHNYLWQKIFVVRVYRTTPDTKDTIFFEQNASYFTYSMFTQVRVEHLKDVPKWVGKGMEKRLRKGVRQCDWQKV